MGKTFIQQINLACLGVFSVVEGCGKESSKVAVCTPRTTFLYCLCKLMWWMNGHMLYGQVCAGCSQFLPILFTEYKIRHIISPLLKQLVHELENPV
jgi:hypothetical protein